LNSGDGKITAYTLFSDNPTAQSFVDDSLYSTYYTSSTGATSCYIGWDFGATISVQITKITYNPRIDRANLDFVGSIFQASNDQVTWTNLFTVDATVHGGLNFWRPATPITT
jgi:hypothetical protein